jgi:hypothetical protein
MVLLAVGGAIALRRRRVPIYPMVAPLLTVFIAITIMFATNRYRASAEGAIALLAAVGIDAVFRWYQHLRTDPEDRPDTDGGWSGNDEERVDDDGTGRAPSTGPAGARP